MTNNESLDEKIRNLKDKIADCRDYISSDFCTQCVSTYREIHRLEAILKDLEDERNRQS
jgi:hypothetical protein